MSKSRVMVALRDAGSVESLVTLACQMAAAMNADLTALHVVEVPPVTPIDADDEILDREGRAILSAAQKVASERFSRKLDTRLLRAREAGEAILGEAKDQGLDLLILGQGGPHSLGDYLAGSAVRHVGRRAPCRILVQIPPSQHAQ